MPEWKRPSIYSSLRKTSRSISQNCEMPLIGLLRLIIKAPTQSIGRPYSHLQPQNRRGRVLGTPIPLTWIFFITRPALRIEFYSE